MSTPSNLGLKTALLRAVETLGYTDPTPVQIAAIGPILQGHDVAAEAQTGSGKTAAFALPILSMLHAETPGVQALTLVPTRELALQVAAAFKSLGQFLTPPPKVLAVIGGEPIADQILSLETGASIVVATPGRLVELLDRGDLSLKNLRFLVLDEADKLLDQGFSDELDHILAAVPSPRQTLLFSATLPASVLALASRALSDAVQVRIDEVATPVATIAQRVFQVDAHQRRMLLQHLIHTESWPNTLIFVATQRAAENVATKLRIAGFSAGALHGGLEQSERIQMLKRFKSGGIGVLVSTDLAARGIDIPNLAAVVNFDLPRSPRDYLHRIGRTGRAGASGTAISFVDHETEAHFRLIEKRCEVRLAREQIEGFELTGEAAKRVKGPAPVKGKRPSKKDKLRAAKAENAEGQVSPFAT